MKNKLSLWSGPKSAAAGILAVAMLITSGTSDQIQMGEYPPSYGLGSAKYLEGTNLLYSLFVDTPDSSWTQEEKENTLKMVGLATEYIEDAAAEYQKEAEFIYDWQENDDLIGQAEVDFSIRDEVDFTDDLNRALVTWKKEIVSYEDYMEAYQVDGMAMLVFVNNPGTSYTIVFDGMDSQKESVILFAQEPLAVYAHEIMHLFGARDLYRGADYTREVTDYIASAYPTEIMYTVLGSDGSKYYDKIVNEVSPITAYHLGWIDYVEEIDMFPELKR